MTRFEPATVSFISLYGQALRLIWRERRSLRPVVRFAVRALRHPAPTWRLFRFFADDAAGLVPRRVLVDSLLRIGREHVRLGLRAGDRADLLIAHHAALGRRFGPAALARFYAGEPLPLARTEASDAEESYEIRFYRAPFGYRREGEATLSVVACASGIRLADVTFAIGGTASHASCLRIGGIQGPPAPDGKAAVKAATKALDGLRPKALALEAIYHLAHCFGASTIFVTSLSHHVLYAKKAKAMHLGPYDSFWVEVGGVALPDGDFLLPAALPHRDAADVPAKRRKEWRRRQERLTALAVDIRQAMASLGPAVPVSAEPDNRRPPAVHVPTPVRDPELSLSA